MRIRTGSAAFIALAVVMASCSDNGLVGLRSGAIPQQATVAAAAMPAVRISEIHYDNTGTDAGESIEISGPAGTDITGWQVVLYNGNPSSGASYNTQTLSGTIPATCGARGVVVVSYASNGIQNGGAGIATEPDGVALVTPAPASTVVEFLSYEGSFTATNGPAMGMVSTNIGVGEAGSEPLGQSLKRDGAGVWSGPSAHSFGVCNDENEVPPAVVADVTIAPPAATIVQSGSQQFTASASDASSQPIAGVTFTWSSADPTVASVSQGGLATGLAPGDARIIATAPNGVADTAELHVNAPAALPATRFSEIHYDNTGTDLNEAIEIEGPANTDLTGWSVVLYNLTGGAMYGTRSLSGSIAERCDGRGVVALYYPTDGIQNGSQDGFALVNASGTVVEFLSYEGVLTATDGPAAGMTSTDIGVAEVNSPVGQSLQRNASGAWTGPTAATVGGCNSGVGGPPPPPPSSISFSGRTPTDAPLPVGFQDQIFASVRDASGTTVTTTITWTSDTPAIASIDQDGVITALAEGTAILRATAEDGTTATYSLPTRVGAASTTAQYQGNAEFGEPADADASDDFIVRRAQYTASYNRNRGIPNWVSYNLEATHFGAEDRCDCFTFDPLLPASFTSYTTADYTGAGTFHGYGIDRGHLARSFDRTSASLDNATTFYFSNIIPQAADLNQGPWATMENYLGDLARVSDKEVYIITGPAGSKGTVKDEGIITIPASVWKVAVIMPRNQGLANIDDLSDFEVIAVIAPNDAGVRSTNWETWKTTVDAVEALSGYNLLALLRDDIEIAVESGTRAPIAAMNGPYSATEAVAVSMSAAASTDPDGDALTFAWTFGDGGVATGATVSHTYATYGSYMVRVIVTDTHGLADTVSTTASVANVPPTIAPATGATINPGDTYTATGSFTDPGAGPFTATVNYGDGSSPTPLTLTLTGKTFTLSHRFNRPGTYTVTVTVTDGDVIATQNRTVVVRSAAQFIQDVILQIEQLVAANRLPAGFGRSLISKLTVLRDRLPPTVPGLEDLAPSPKPLLPLLTQFISTGKEIDGLVRGNRITAADAETVRTLIGRILKLVTNPPVGPGLL